MKASVADLALEQRADVQRLLSTLSQPPYRRVAARIAVPALRGVVRTRVELRLNAALRDCGCTTGNAVTTLAVVGYLAFLSATGGWSAGVLEPLFVCTAIAIAAGVAGKAVGVAVARMRLVRELRALEVLLPE
jgi:hypothetical protein